MIYGGSSKFISMSYTWVFFVKIPYFSIPEFFSLGKKNTSQICYLTSFFKTKYKPTHIIGKKNVLHFYLAKTPSGFVNMYFMDYVSLLAWHCNINGMQRFINSYES